VAATVTAVRAHFGPAVRVGIHLHDDTGCGVANSVAAIHAGAVHVQGTINGYGERCGNANLCAVIPNIELKLNMRALPAGSLARLHEVARFVAEVANFAPNDQMAYVGDSAFAHKAGVHVSAIAAPSRRLPAHRPDDRRQRDAGGGQRTFRPGQRGLQGGREGLRTRRRRHERQGRRADQGEGARGFLV